ncbi:MAG: methylated-DNA--[protein]-cysteine S-methyltransferase [Candidatus Aminicenantes bacterium]|nr:methylated-DNA--[protein]-cysteine S-methyltransferase [Candidatus Aminicenantes bacterium]MDH5705909.1 methylated-DNA--[protein]-cysteine S-methyltransferase [Candidatus Aminicenantes bacterium]
MFSTILDIPKGKIFLAKTEKGLSYATFLKNKSQLKEIEGFLKRKGIPLQADPSLFRLEERLFKKYFEGEEEDFISLPLDFVSGTPYQRKVWLEARKIPYGKTISYKSLAQRLNHRGYRSTGQALGRNPLLIIIPCHRVIRADGSLGGFGLGLDFKEYLLRLERGEKPV